MSLTNREQIDIKKSNEETLQRNSGNYQSKDDVTAQNDGIRYDYDDSSDLKS
ncbi:hypothetical protein [Bacillus sp. Marseille-P3661]|uniref:hypothetical protein n=1 Tax=Bacillus sp. Marseille-P3661 TaxID=1936234 RepID=UPI0015E1AC54|nr:hypothetical protein [Bacillus sp. Marseille-P3661]